MVAKILILLFIATIERVSGKNSALQCLGSPYPELDTFDTNVQNAIQCLHRNLGGSGADNTTDALWYSSATNDRATLQENSRIAWGFVPDPDPPAIIARPKNNKQVKVAFRCSVRNGLRVVPWGKGHNFQGLTAISNYSLIRMDGICDVYVNKRRKTMTISAGCATGYQVAKLSLFGKKEMNNRMLLNFGCPNIGIGGSFSGGGQGYFSGYVGMQIDGVEKVWFLTYNKRGKIREVVATNKRNKDLFWAARGGVGGYGIITKIELRTLETPSPDAVTWTDLYYGADSRGTAKFRFQELLLGNSRFGIAQTNRFDLGGSQVRVSYLGPAVEAVQKLKEAGLIDASLLDTSGTYDLTPEESSVFKDYSETCTGAACSADPYGLPERGVNIFQFPNFREFSAMAWFNPALVDRDNVCGEKYGFDCGPNSQGIPGQYSFISNQDNALRTLEMAADVESDFLDPTSPFWISISRVAFQAPGLQWRLTESGWNRLAEVRDNANAAGCTFTFLFPHATGGVAAAVPPSDTAYAWRGYPLVHIFLGNLGAEECKSFLEDVNALRIEHAVEGFSSGGAYVNYPGDADNCCNAAGDVSWEQVYYGDNYARLQRIRKKYDPLSIFSKPQLPEPKRECQVKKK